MNKKYWICTQLKTGCAGIEYKPGEIIDYTPYWADRGTYFREATNEEVEEYLKTRIETSLFQNGNYSLKNK